MHLIGCFFFILRLNDQKGLTLTFSFSRQSYYAFYHFDQDCNGLLSSKKWRLYLQEKLRLRGLQGLFFS